MEKYVNQLLELLEHKILKRWTKQVPHYYESGIPDPYLIPPKGWNKEKHEYLESETPEPLFETKIGEMEKWLEQTDQNMMFREFGLEPKEFPPVSKLTNEQVRELSVKLLRLWAAYNFTAVLPDKLPYDIVYKTLLKRMLEPSSFVNFGHVGIEFCDYVVEDCPFPLEFCSCKDF